MKVMKKSVVNLTVIALVALFSTSFVSVNAQSLPEFIYNSYEENGKVISKQVCKMDAYSGMHQPHLKYEYSYTEQGLPQSCTALRWNKKTASWENSHVLTYEYDELISTVTLNYALWSKDNNSFDMPQEKAVYQYLDTENLSYYTQYEKESIDSDWEIKTHFSMNNYFLSQLIK